MDEVYRGYRFICRNDDGVWTTHIYEVRGNALPVPSESAATAAACASKAKAIIDRYLDYLGALR